MSAKTDTRQSRILEVFPYLCVRNASAAMDFYFAVFGAEESRSVAPEPPFICMSRTWIPWSLRPSLGAALCCENPTVSDSAVSGIRSATSGFLATI